MSLSKSMEKTFRRMTKSLDERNAYVSAEVTTALAHQIRALRTQRGMTQAELADRMGTKQHVISRLEDPSYGRLSLNTLLQLSRAFDTGLQVQFVPLVGMLRDTFQPSAEARLVPSFEEEVGSAP
jgi:transcriptional regulator with XRE-family HTH domain